MFKGTVKWFNTKRGYGVIQPQEGGKDVFVHATRLEKTGLRKLFDGQLFYKLRVKKSIKFTIALPANL